MIPIDRLLQHVAGVSAGELRRWVEQDWVRPDGAEDASPDSWWFHDIDVARLRLIVELRDDMGVDETALPVVLSLLDQLYETRRQMLRLRDAMESAMPEDIRLRLIDHLHMGTGPA
jgi:chaperone modulatory protein CbpM